MAILKLKELLDSKRMKPSDLAKIAQLTMPTVNSLYANTTNRIEFSTLEKLCKALECTPNDLIKFD